MMAGVFEGRVGAGPLSRGRLAGLALGRGGAGTSLEGPLGARGSVAKALGGIGLGGTADLAAGGAGGLRTETETYGSRPSSLTEAWGHESTSNSEWRATDKRMKRTSDVPAWSTPA